VADLRITQLPPLTGALLGATDPLAIADLSASETKKITAKDLVQFGVGLIDDGSIPAVKVNFVLPPGSVGTTELVDGAVTAIKLANQSSGVVQAGLPATGSFIGQLTVNTVDNRAYVWSGGAWLPFRAAGSVNTLTYNNTLSPLTIGGVVSGDNIELGVIPNNTTAPAQFMAGPSGAGGNVDYRTIVGADLPPATALERGAIVVNGGGLTVTGDVISIDNTIVAGVTYGVVTYNEKGLVTDGRPISALDLPIATAVAPGAIALGSQFTASVNNELQHANNITPGTAAKVQFNGQGHITASLPLEAIDIPELNANKITSGTLSSALFGDRTITASAMADYSTAYIQEGNPGSASGLNFAGQLWLQESTAQLRMWNGNSWYAVGLGRLVQENLRWGGLIDASTGFVTTVTQFGLTSGLAVGAPLPLPNDQLSGLYVAVKVAGSNIGVTPGVNYDEGDWCLCVDQANGWERIDTMTGGGGGGGVQFLDDLQDVDALTPLNNEVLTFESFSGNWVNKAISFGALAVTAPITKTGTAAAPIIGIDPATDLLPGSMSAADKAKLDAATALATPSTLMFRDANGDTAVNKITAAVFDIDALPALP
jgi:hypothetical protein